MILKENSYKQTMALIERKKERKEGKEKEVEGGEKGRKKRKRGIDKGRKGLSRRVLHYQPQRSRSPGRSALVKLH